MILLKFAHLPNQTSYSTNPKVSDPFCNHFISFDSLLFRHISTAHRKKGIDTFAHYGTVFQ